MNLLRRISLTRLLLLCGATIAIGISATALALALGSGPTPPAKPLAQAVHDALAGGQSNPVQGYTASVKLTDHLVEGAELATGGDGRGGLAGSPLLTGANGRIWVSDDGRMRLELQAEQGDTQIVYDGHTVTMYDAASNTVYRYTPKPGEGDQSGYEPLATHNSTSSSEEVPSVAKVEEALANARKHVKLSEATPTDVGGRPAYTVRVSPDEGGSLIGGAELSFDADNGLPLRTAVYSSTSSAPVIELAAGEVSYGPVDPSVFAITPPAGAKVEELTISHDHTAKPHEDSSKPSVTTHGEGIGAIAVIQAKSSSKTTSASLENLPKVKIGSQTASELRTELGTILTFERNGVRYVLAGAVQPAAVEALARGL